MLLCFRVKDIHYSHGMVSTLYGSYLRDLKLKNGEIFKNAQTRPIFELEKCSFFKWVRIGPEIDWYYYPGACPAPTCIVRHQTMTKTRTS